jgi:hypothetical protein
VYTEEGDFGVFGVSGFRGFCRFGGFWFLSFGGVESAVWWVLVLSFGWVESAVGGYRRVNSGWARRGPGIGLSQEVGVLLLSVGKVPL